ncbi:hypothetical protein OG612_24115 [Streptomyces sp. NBC_01527]|uniref:hypothetical protein n=1 Tax=unclassified Streptomyces TaxID=2593676 RepID=UPI002E111187|nr:hypothetical protein OG763_19530 [Streptomyces sp. NBC_01230]
MTMILPALTEATSPLFRPIKYSLFPPLGLATLAGYLDPDDEVTLLDEHVERVDIESLDSPDLLVVQPYITSARRSYEIADHFRARGVHVAMGGLHVTSLPDEAAAHADTIFTGPGERLQPAHPGRTAARTREPGQAEPVTGSQLNRRLVRMPAPVRCLPVSTDVLIVSHKPTRYGADHAAQVQLPSVPEWSSVFRAGKGVRVCAGGLQRCASRS